MERAGVIDWHSAETHLLLNPRMPGEAREKLARMARSVSLRGHVLLATSGSTELKLCALSKEAILASAAAVNRHLDAKSAEPWCCVLPAFHVGGLGIYARAELSGARVVALEWNANRFAELCSGEKIAFASLVPTQITDLVRENIASPDSLRAIIVGGGALAPELYSPARELRWNLLPSYGMTECASQIATASLSSLQQERFPDLELLPHLRARSEAEGRLAFSGSSLFTGYVGEAGLLDPKIDGWFVSDDCGEVDARDGRTIVTVEGRATDVVKIGGELVNLIRLEEIFGRVACDTDAALLPLPDERLGHILALAVAGQPDAAARIEAAFNALVLPFERIRKIYRVSEIPRSPLGKVQRQQLMQMIRDQRPGIS